MCFVCPTPCVLYAMASAQLWKHAARLGHACRHLLKDEALLDDPDGEIYFDLLGELLSRIGARLRPVRGVPPQSNLDRARADTRRSADLLATLALRTPTPATSTQRSESAYSKHVSRACLK